MPALPHLTAFFLLHLHHVWAQCAAVQLGLAAYPALTGMQETPQGQSCSANLLGPGYAPVLGPPSVLACPRLGDSCA